MTDILPSDKRKFQSLVDRRNTLEECMDYFEQEHEEQELEPTLWLEQKIKETDEELDKLREDFIGKYEDL